ncbi:MAG: CBS domain-containing protein [Pirellulales bacterium]
MTDDVLTFSPETTVDDAIRTLLERRISGAPVVDADGQIRGIISEYQLLEVVFTPNLRSSTVGKCMTADVVTVSEDAPLTDVATQFVLHRIRRLPVVRDGRLVGVVSRRDLLRKVVESGAEVLPVGASA